MLSHAPAVMTLYDPFDSWATIPRIVLAKSSSQMTITEGIRLLTIEPWRSINVFFEFSSIDVLTEVMPINPTPTFTLNTLTFSSSMAHPLTKFTLEF